MPTADDYAFMEMSSHELDLAIGGELTRDGLGAKDLSDAEKISAAQRWFDVSRGRLRGQICTDPTIRGTLFGRDKQERNVLFASVFDIVARIGGFPVPVGAITAKLIHYGLDQLCGDGSAEASS